MIQANADRNSLAGKFDMSGNFLLPALFSLVAGALLTLAFYPFNCFYVIPISFTALLHTLSYQQSKKRQFLVGFLFGLGHFTTSLYWISYSLFVEADKFAWLAPFAVLLIPSCIAVFLGVLTTVLSTYIKFSRTVISIIFPSLWVVIEMLRSYLIFPFPWNSLGYASNFSLEVMQIASVFGVYGLSFLLALCGSVFYSKNIPLILGTYAVMALLYGWGEYRIHDGKKEMEEARSFNIRLVQPNIVEHHYGDPNKQLKILEELMSLSLRDNIESVDFLIWPESSLPFIITTNSPWINKLLRFIPEKTTLIFGTDRYEIENKKVRIYNSMMAINNQNNLIDTYDKNILVPFGEYQPFRSYLPFLDKITYGMQDFEPGKQLRELLVNKKESVIPLICYEAIFFLKSFNKIAKKSLFSLNITNDFWFGDSIGPYQHFAMSRMRAIEYGMPLVRVGNTGISASIDAYGHVLKKLNLNSKGVVDDSLKIFKKNTFRCSESFCILLMPLILLGLLVGVANYVIYLYK